MNKQNILIYALDSDLAVVGVVDEFTCFQYTASWTGIGDWTITLNASQKADIDALKAAEFIRVDGIGSGIITKITEDIQPSGRSYKVQGVQLKGLAQKRIVMNTNALTGKPCAICEQLLIDNLLEPSNVKRKIPGVITAVQDVGDSIEYTAKYDVLSDTLQELCETYDLGWDAALDDDGIHWYIKAGVDRTLGQTANEVLLIGYDVDTLDAATYEQTKDVKNTAIVGGSGEGSSRTIEIVGDDNTGLARTELFVEARSEDDLAAKGSEALSAYGTDNILETKPSELLLHRFLDGEFALGDVGTLLDHDNVSCRLTECVYIFEGNSIEIRFSYGYGVQTIADAIKAATSNYNALLKSEGTGGGGGAVNSVNGKTGTVVLTYSDVGALPSTTVVPTKTSQLTNDSGFLTAHQSLAAYRTSAEQDTIDAGKVSVSDYNPTAKTGAMTQAVGKDAEGKLWTSPGSGGGGEWVQFTPNGSGISVATTCYKKVVNGMVYLRGACRYTPALAQSGTADFHSNIGADYTPSEAVVLPLAGDYANFLLYVNPNGSMQIRNRTDASRTNMWFRIDCSYAI